MDESLNYEAIIAQLQAENELLRLQKHVVQGVSLPVFPSLIEIEKWLREHYILVMVAFVLLAFVAQIIVLIAERVHP